MVMEVSPTVTLVTVPGLAMDTFYDFSISAITQAGESQRSAITRLYTTPRAPILAHTVSGSAENDNGETSNSSSGHYANATSIPIHWDVPGSTGSPVVEYRLYDRLFNSTTEWHLNSIVSAPVTDGLLRNLSGGQQYEITVSAWNAAGEGPRMLDSVVAFTAPGVSPPESSSPSASTSIHLNWPSVVAHSLAPLLTLELRYRNLSDVGGELYLVPLGLGAQALTIRGLLPSTLYGFSLRAMNAVGAEITEETIIGTAPDQMGPMFLLPNAMVTSYLLMISWTPMFGHLDTPLAVQRYAVFGNDGAQIISTHALYGSDTQVLSGLQAATDYNCTVSSDRESFTLISGSGPLKCLVRRLQPKINSALEHRAILLRFELRTSV